MLAILLVKNAVSVALIVSELSFVNFLVLRVILFAETMLLILVKVSYVNRVAFAVKGLAVRAMFLVVAPLTLVKVAVEAHTLTETIPFEMRLLTVVDVSIWILEHAYI